MNEPEKHIFVCGSFRSAGDAPLVSYLEAELSDRGMDGYRVSTCGCLKACIEGPLMVVYPDCSWYGRLSEDRIDGILDAWERGESDQIGEVA